MGENPSLAGLVRCRAEHRTHVQAISQRASFVRLHHEESIRMNTAQALCTSAYLPSNGMIRTPWIDPLERTSLHEMLDLIGVSVEPGPLKLAAQPAVRRLRAGESLFVEGAAAT